MENWSTQELNFANENDTFSLHNQLPPPDFGFPEMRYNVSYDSVLMPLEQHHNEFDAFPWLNSVSEMNFGSSSLNREILPLVNPCGFQNQYLLPESFTDAPVNDFMNVSGVDYGSSFLNQENIPIMNSSGFQNHYLLPESFTYTPVNDFMNVSGVDYGSSSLNQENIPIMNSSGFQNQMNQPLMITYAEGNNGGPITNSMAMDYNKGKNVETVDQFQMENLKWRNPILIMEKERSLENNGNGGGTSKVMLSREIISKYFYMPIKQAAKELTVGITLFKKSCRELGINRWPQHKLMSLQTLINNVQELSQDYGDKSKGKFNEATLILERERKKMEEIPDLQLEHKTKRLRQYCYKRIYKKRRNMGGVVPSTSCTSITRQKQLLSSCSNASSINPLNIFDDK